MGMKQSGAPHTGQQMSSVKGKDMVTREWIPYAAAGVLLLAEWALLWLVGSPLWPWLVYVGWALLFGGIALIALPLLLLPRSGEAPPGQGITETTRVVDSGLYAVVRHPLYLGWMLVHVALVLLAQHWLVLVIAVIGLTCVYVICLQEERRLLARFGEEYARYMGAVPRVNLLTGIVRLLGR